MLDRRLQASEQIALVASRLGTVPYLPGTDLSAAEIVMASLFTTMRKLARGRPAGRVIVDRIGSRDRAAGPIAAGNAA